MPVLQDKVIVVTGAGRGIGRSVAVAAAAEGARVVVADYGTALDGSAPDTRVAEAVVEEIRDLQGDAIAIAESVCTADGSAAIVNAALETWGCLDGVVCCAGILRHRPFLELSEFDFDAVIATHLKGHFLIFQRSLAAIKRLERGGSLVGIGSGYVLGDAGRAPYRAAKAGVVGLTMSVALAGQECGVRANVISPIADTRMTEASGMTIGAGPDDIAPMALYLLSDRSRGITGEVFSVSGRTIASWDDPHEERVARNAAPWLQEEIDAVMPWLRGGGRNVR